MWEGVEIVLQVADVDLCIGSAGCSLLDGNPRASAIHSFPWNHAGHSGSASVARQPHCWLSSAADQRPSGSLYRASSVLSDFLLRPPRALARRKRTRDDSALRI